MTASVGATGGGDLASIVERWAARAPEREAVAFEGASESYGELAAAIAQTATALASRGVGSGDRVAWLGPNRPSALHLLFACSRLGAIYLPLNSRLTVAEHQWILNDAESSLVVCDPSFTDHATEAASCSVEELADGQLLDAGAAGVSTVRHSAGTLASPVLLAYTSGTTGNPKGALLDQQALVANAVNSAHAHDLTRDDRVLTPIPLFHVGGLNIQTVPALLCGAAVLLHRAFDPGLFLDDLERWRPTWSVLVPVALQAVAAHPRFASADFSSLRGLMTGSSLVPPAATRPFFEAGVPVGEIYGATETAPIAAHLRADEAADHPGSCGKASSLCEVQLVGDDGNDVEPGERGELWVRGPTVLREYWRNPQATAEALVDGWYRTGDVGHADGDGWLHIDDRLRDLIISGGENVYPAEVEAQLESLALLAEFAVIGQPHPRWGEVPVVVAVVAEGSAGERLPASGEGELPLYRDPKVTAAVRQHLEPRLARFKLPADVVLTDSLPRTALGKVRKGELRELLSRES